MAEAVGDEPSAVRWLSAEERSAWLDLTRLLTVFPAALDAQLERDAGLNYFEYVMLAMLSEKPDRTRRMSDLAAVTNSSLSRLSNVAKRLEQRGLLCREPDPADRRATRAVLSDAGWDLVVRTAPRHVEAVRALFIDALTPAELRDLQQTTARILRRLDPDATSDPRQYEVDRRHGQD